MSKTVELHDNKIRPKAEKEKRFMPLKKYEWRT